MGYTDGKKLWDAIPKGYVPTEPRQMIRCPDRTQVAANNRFRMTTAVKVVPQALLADQVMLAKINLSLPEVV
jgi:hypothetical protein